MKLKIAREVVMIAQGARTASSGFRKKMENNQEAKNLKYKVEQQRKFEGVLADIVNETNIASRELVKQLILVDTVFLSVSVFIFNTNFLANKLTNIDKHFLAFFFSLIILSLVSGILQFWVDYRFFRKWTDAVDKIIKLIKSCETVNPSWDYLERQITKEQQAVPKDSPHTFLILQASLLILGVILLTIVMTKLLFLL